MVEYLLPTCTITYRIHVKAKRLDFQGFMSAKVEASTGGGKLGFARTDTAVAAVEASDTGSSWLADHVAR